MDMPATPERAWRAGPGRAVGAVTRGDSDAGAEPPGGTNGYRLTHVSGWMKEGNAAQHHRARPSGEGLRHRLGPGAEGALGLDRHLAIPVLGLEATDHLARAESHRVAVLAERAGVDLPRQLRDLGAGHADAEIVAGDAEPLHPRVVEDLGTPGQHRVDDDVLGPGDVPHEPRQRVEVLARSDAHLLV